MIDAIRDHLPGVDCVDPGSVPVGGIIQRVSEDRVEIARRALGYFNRGERDRLAGTVFAARACHRSGQVGD